MRGRVLCKPSVERGIQSNNWNNLVSPTTLDEYVGQVVLKNELNTMMQAAQVHGIRIQPILFSGSFGLGKTTIAKIFADTISNDWSIVTAANLSGVRDLPQDIVVIIDEIHTLKEEEWLLEIIDEGEQIVFGATTTAGSISAPLRSRFVSMVLKPYTVDELITIVKNAAKKIEYDCPHFVAEGIARRSKTVGRLAIVLFKRIFDRIVISGDVTEMQLESWFRDMEIDENGLENDDRAYLSCLSERPVGIQNLCAMASLDRVTVEEAIEPYLTAQGYVIRTARGRIKGKRMDN